VVVLGGRGSSTAQHATPRTVLVLDGRTATVVRTVAVGLPPEALAVDQRRGRIVVTHADDARVSLVEATSGRVLRKVPVGLPPLALAVDQRRGARPRAP
jgi:DNA-binding beta-propeller fold protein YncE